MDYFEFYNISPAFLINENALKKAFYEKSRIFHPDHHTKANDDQQAEMLELASFNNQAYRTLSDFDRRMQYILECKNLLGNEKENVAMPQDFLLEMMDINEAIMELQFDPDPTQIAQIRSKIANFETNLDQEVRPFLENWKDNNTPESFEILRAVKNFFLKKRYLLRILQNLSTFAASK